MMKRRRYKIWMMLFGIGFFVGILLMSGCRNLFIQEEGIFDRTVISRMQYADLDNMEFFAYVLKLRMRTVIYLGLISTTCIATPAIVGWVMWKGIIAGMWVTASLICFGLKGMLLILAGIFPHQLLFIPALLMMLGWCCKEVVLRNRKQYYLQKGLTFLWIMFVVGIGCVLEAYVNPILLLDTIKIF